MSSTPDQTIGCQTRSTVTDDGISIVYDAYLQADTSRVVLIVPGFWRTRSWPSLVAMVRVLSDSGHSVAILDVRGHGDSGGRYTFNRAETLDVEAVVRDLIRLDGVEEIDLIGFSVGGAISTCTAARGIVPAVSLTLISPVARFGWIRPRLSPWKFSRHLAAGQALRMPRFEWSFAWSRKEIAVEAMPRVSVPTLVIHARGDWLIHHRHGEALHEAAGARGSLQLLDLDDGYHADRIFSAAPGVAEKIVLKFLSNARTKRPPRGGRD